MTTPTLYDWCGGQAALERLTTVFYDRILNDPDPVLEPVFRGMDAHHAQHVAAWLGEVFGGPAVYTQEHGGYPHMLGKHLGLGLTELQRATWVRRIGEAADAAGLPDDPEFRSAFVAYVEWGSRLAVANSQEGAEPPPAAPVPRWGWGEAPPWTPS